MSVADRSKRRPAFLGEAVFTTSRGRELCCDVVRFSTDRVVLESYAPASEIREGEEISNLKVETSSEQASWTSASVQRVIETEGRTIAELATKPNGNPAVVARSGQRHGDTAAGPSLKFAQQFSRIPAEAKAAVVDLQVFLLEVRTWLDRVERESQVAGNGQERELLVQIRKTLAPYAVVFFDRFEQAFQSLGASDIPFFSVFVKQQLHPLTLCAPFMHRTFAKPLGYPGDYEMVNMMVRDPFEGPSLYAKLLNSFFLDTPPVVAHRNRIDYLRTLLEQEGQRKICGGSRLKVFNLGCGPAREIQRFISESPLAQNTDFNLVDFSRETLEFTNDVLRGLNAKHGGRANLRVEQRSVAQLIRDALSGKRRPDGASYDLVYCAGLFDYLDDGVCAQLLKLLANLVAPGGLIAATNVEKSNPSRGWMECAVDWYLFYRDQREMLSLWAAENDEDDLRLVIEETGVNVILEARRPGDVA